MVSQLKKHTVLIVEDVEEISSNMAAALNKRGHSVRQATNAEQAIRMAEADRPAMILTDLDLPTFDKLLSLLRDHVDLKTMAVAIIDINTPTLKDGAVSVLPDFQALDDLMESSQQPTK
jgi:DNA-binding response OmpR family regulator